MVNFEDFADELDFLNIVRRAISPEYIVDPHIWLWFSLW